MYDFWHLLSEGPGVLSHESFNLVLLRALIPFTSPPHSTRDTQGLATRVENLGFRVEGLGFCDSSKLHAKPLLAPGSIARPCQDPEKSYQNRIEPQNPTPKNLNHRALRT